MLQIFQFNETSPAAAGGAASAAAVTGADPTATLGEASFGLDEAVGLLIIGELVGATGGTLDVYLQTLLLGVWYDIAHFKQLGAGASAVKQVFVAGPGYSQNSVAIGADASPALAADTVVGGPWGEKVRLYMVAGASTSAGAAVKVTLLAQLPRQYAQR